MAGGTLLDVLERGEPKHPAVVVPDGPSLTYEALPGSSKETPGHA